MEHALLKLKTAGHMTQIVVSARHAAINLVRPPELYQMGAPRVQLIVLPAPRTIPCALNVLTHTAMLMMALIVRRNLFRTVLFTNQIISVNAPHAKVASLETVLTRAPPALRLV